MKRTLITLSVYLKEKVDNFTTYVTKSLKLLMKLNQGHKLHRTQNVIHIQTHSMSFTFTIRKSQSVTNLEECLLKGHKIPRYSLCLEKQKDYFYLKQRGVRVEKMTFILVKVPYVEMRLKSSSPWTVLNRVHSNV